MSTTARRSKWRRTDRGFGELSTTTIGWVVLVTVGNMALDKAPYRVNFPTSKWLAAMLAVAVLAYLLIDVRRSDSA